MVQNNYKLQIGVMSPSSMNLLRQLLSGLLPNCLVVLLLVFAFLLLSGCGGGSGPASGAGSQIVATPSANGPTADPLPGDPLPGDPLPSDPLPSDPLPSDPLPSDPLPGDPLPGDPLPSDPLPGDPLPGDPLPGDPLPGDPLPGDPLPSDPLPSDPLPSDPLPSDPLPSDPLPSDPDPVDPIRIEVVPQLTGFNRVSDQLWDETAVRKVLHTFAFGGQATDARIIEWANMPPAQAITEMLTFDEHNLLLSPVGPQDYDRLDTRDGTLRGLAEFWSSDDPDNGIYIEHRPEYEPNRYKNLVWVRATTSRGLNPFRQKIGLWETNYHMAVNQLAGPTSEQIIRYYDDIMSSLERGLSYQDVMTVAALSAAILRQYGQNYFANGVCRCNEDFAREYYQLFFGILGEYNPFLHETVTIKNTAKALTGITIPRNSKGDYLDSTLLLPEFHYPDTLSMLDVEIGGSSAPERFEQLASYAIAHEESLDNLPVKIIQGLADDNLTDEKVKSIRSAWRSMQEKNLLDFIRAYAISDIFHDEHRVKYLTSVDRHLMIVTQMSLNNEENYLDLYDPYGPSSFEDEGMVVFQPAHNVFGGQTGIEASDSMDIFRNNYNRFTGYPSLWYRRTSINRYGREWAKEWATVAPHINETYPVKLVAEWLWNRFVGDGLKNFGELERAHVYALLATDRDIGYLRDSSDPGRVLGTNDLKSDLNLIELVQDLAVSEMALGSSEATDRTTANRRIGTAINFILATPYIFAQEGR